MAHSYTDIVIIVINVVNRVINLPLRDGVYYQKMVIWFKCKTLHPGSAQIISGCVRDPEPFWWEAQAIKQSETGADLKLGNTMERHST